jgi:Pyridoxamine 5'-phosphate oxidase
MTDHRDPAAAARAIIDANLYMVLGTADEQGRPWTTPVYYAHSQYREFFWASRPGRLHSSNLAARPELGIVIFDSSLPINTGNGVYMTAVATELGPDEWGEPLAAYSRRAIAHGGDEMTPDDVRAPAPLRLYRASAVDQWVLDENDDRVSVSL